MYIPIANKYDDATTTIEVSSSSYKTFKSFMVSRSIDDMCGRFSLTMSRPKGASPIRTGDIINISLDGKQVMRGRVYKALLEGDASSDYISLAGRDITADVFDSTVPDTCKVFSDSVSILSMIQSIVRDMGLSKEIAVINKTGDVINNFTDTEVVSAKLGKKVSVFIHKYARKRQLFINTDVNGNIILFRADGIFTPNKLINRAVSDDNNVIGFSVSRDISKRYYKYICKSQSSNGWGDSEVDATGYAIDDEISENRVLEFKLEEGQDSTECRERAIEESNVRRARGFEYTVTVSGHKDKTLWEVNQFVLVDDDKADVHGIFIVKKVEYTLNLRQGRITKLVLTSKDAYTLQASIDSRAKQESGSGSLWNNSKALLGFGDDG